MSYNPWLITWEVVNESNPVPDCLIAAILPNQTGEHEVKKMMRFIYCFDGTVREKLAFAKHNQKNKSGHEPVRDGMKENLYLGDSPFLHARHVFDFVVTGDDGEEVVTWIEQEPVVPKELATRATQFKRRRCTYRAATNKIEEEHLGD